MAGMDENPYEPPENKHDKGRTLLVIAIWFGLVVLSSALSYIYYLWFREL